MATLKLLVPEPIPIEVDKKKLMSDWNDYTDWLAKKGYKGHAALDKKDLGGKMIDLYKKENPNTTLSREMIKPIQQEFSRYRDYTLNEIKNRRALYTDSKSPQGRYVAPDEDLSGYMKDLSIVDGIAGQRTTQHRFPERYITTVNLNNNTSTTKNLGFAALQK